MSVSRVYVPNEYDVYLAPVDRKQFDGYEDKLCEELQDYLAEHARREHYVLLSTPVVKLETDSALEMGMFGIATRLARAPAEEPQRRPEPSATVIYKPVELPPPSPSIDSSGRTSTELAAVTIAGERHELHGEVTVLGRSKDCDIQVMDPNVSRRHAEIQRRGDNYVVVDLGSTNGIEVDQRRVKELVLQDGSRFTVGSSEIVFSRETR